MSSAKRILALPLILLALLAQGLAPAAAAVMTARMADPLASLPMCSSSDLGGAQRDDTSAPASQHQQVCDACSVCAEPVMAMAPDTPVLSAPVAPRGLAKPPVEIVGPRGPPLLTPRARGPPLHA